MKRLLSIFIIIALALTVYFPGLKTAHAAKPAPVIEAQAGILVDAETGEILWQKNPHAKRAIASTTKIMTAILAIESDRLDDTVTVTADVLEANRWGIKLLLNEEIKLEDLLYALMLNSANDSAVAIANKIGGTTDNFISMMNLKARNLGAENTFYTNPHGLPDGRPYSTAYDLSLITRYAMKNKTFSKIVAARSYYVQRTGMPKPYFVENRNKLLWTYQGATGVKTGHTNDAGFCLVSAAEKRGVSLIAVVLGSKAPDGVFKESADILDYGFSLYESRRIIDKKRVYRKIKVGYGQEVELVPSSNVYALVRPSAGLTTSITTGKNLNLPLKKGTKLGRITIKQAERVIAEAPLVAREDLASPSLSQVFGFYLSQIWTAVF